MNIPNPLLNKVQSISFEERDKLIHFNTKRYWHCFYNKDTNKLYNEYCRLLMDNAYDYLLKIGLIDENKNTLEYFEE